jgi:protease IV
VGTSGRWFWGIVAAFVGAGFLVLAAAVFVLASAVTASMDGTQEESPGSGTDRVAVVEVSGVIDDVDDVLRQLRMYRDRASVKAIVLRLDSPGGGVVPSHEVHEEVRRIVGRGKPVVVSMGSLAASGAYYIACAASRIVANPGTITGSIGVISEFADISRLLEKLGIRATTIKSGKFKDIGSAARPMTSEDIALMQATIDDVYGQFLDVVSQGRHMPVDSVRRLADGRVYTGRQAMDLGLVDTLGTLQTSISIAGTLAHIAGEPRITREVHEPSLLDRALGRENARTLDRLRTAAGVGAPLEYRLRF